MSTRLKEKVVAAIRRLFRAAEKTGNDVADGEEGGESAAAAAAGGTSSTSTPPGNEAFSPSRRSLPAKHGHFRHYNDHLCHHPHHYRKTGKEIYNCYLRSTGKDAQGKSSSSCPDHRGVRPRRLMKELAEIQRFENRRDATFTAELVNDNLYEWHVRLHRIDPDSELANDMKELAIPHILLHVIFPENFPFAPPFMRVVSPRIERGFVMEGGAICMELLTPRGWASAYTVEAVVTQFAASIVKGQGRVARKAKTSKEFSRRSAEESFRSLVKTHEKYGWVTPPLAEG